MFKNFLLVLGSVFVLTLAASSCGSKKEDTTGQDSLATDTTSVATPAPDTLAQSAGIEVPEAVKAAFKAKFPNATESTDWEAESNGVYEVNFTMDSRSYEAEFDSTGVWRETDSKIEISAVPAEVANGFKKSKHKAATVVGVEELSLPKYDKLFEYQIVKGKDTSLVRFDPKGKEVVIK